MAMDEETLAKYEAWKRKKILKSVSKLALLSFIVIGVLVLALGGSADESEVPVNGKVDGNDQRDAETNTEDEYEDDGSTTISIQFAGDVFLHEQPIAVARTGNNTYDFRLFVTHIAPFIDGDLAIANMETPVDAWGGNQGVLGFPLFNAPFEILEALQYAGFNHLISANNHAFDMGFEGLINTVNNFERAGISHTGMNRSWDDYNTPTIIDVNGIQVGILAYSEHFNGEEWRIPEASRAYAVRQFNSANLNDIPRITGDMDTLRAAGAEVVIVALHWGYEYGDHPLPSQEAFAHALTAAGADVIMGKHSHTVHPIEWHEREDGSRALVMYSLGNFVADQTRLFRYATTPAEVLYLGWNVDGSTNFAGRTQFGMLVTLAVTRAEDGTITLGTVDVLPTLCLRDFTGQTLGAANDVTVMPLINGELPDFVTDEALRHWGQVAYEHVTSIVGEAFINVMRE
ncbi:MAG: CapA family protein [Turicibacter sp.]|nr:CapA family protein [Turicibacter sp.]